MKNVLTIAGRQFRSYFNGPVAYIVICIVMLTLGFFFWKTFFLFGRASAREMFRWLSLILVFALIARNLSLSLTLIAPLCCYLIPGVACRI